MKPQKRDSKLLLLPDQAMDFLKSLGFFLEKPLDNQNSNVSLSCNENTPT